MRRPDHPHLAVATIGLGSWLFILSGGIANIALPHLTAELCVPASDVVWVTIAFQIAAVSCAIPFAALSEVIGIRKVYVGGLFVFALGSLACAFAADFTQVVLARTLQGLGAAGISAVNAALVRRTVPEHMVGRIVGLLSVVVGAAQGAAPIVGSFILEFADWRWLFAYDLPITVLAAALALYAIPRDEEFRTCFDHVSAILCALTLSAGFLAFDRIARAPDGPVAYVLLLAAALAGTVLVRRQRNRDRPLFPVDLFALPQFALPGAISALTYAAQAVALTVLPFLLVSSPGMSLLQAGAMISTLPLATLLTSPLAGVLCDRFPRWQLSVTGCLVMAAGFAGLHLFASLPERTTVTPLLAVLGIGFALFQNHNAKAMILGAPLRRIGAAGGVQSTVRVVGMTVGPALVGISFHAFLGDAENVAILAGAILCLVAASIGLAGLLFGARGR